MAANVPTPTSSELAVFGAKYKVGQIDPHTQKVLMVMAKAWQLKNQANQDDYTASGMNQLSADAARATAGMQQADLDAIHVGLAWSVADDVAGAPALLKDQLAQMGLLAKRTDDELARMDLLLEYKLQLSSGA